MSISTQAAPVGTKLALQTSATGTADNDVFGGACTLYVVDVDNTANGVASFLKLYNSAAPTVGTTAPDYVFRIPASVRRSFTMIEGVALTNLSMACVTAGGTAGTSSPGSAVPVRLLAS